MQTILHDSPMTQDILQSIGIPNLKNQTATTPKLWPGRNSLEMSHMTQTTHFQGWLIIGRVGFAMVNIRGVPKKSEATNSRQ